MTSTVRAHIRSNVVASMAPIFALGIAALGALGAPASAGHVSCGQTITEDTTLDSDLNCTGDGIVIGAPDITLDLGGHTIAGDGGLGDDGIDNRAGHDGVEVTNGTIQSFGYGVYLIGATQNRLHGLAVSGNDLGIILQISAENSVAENQLTGNRSGIDLADADRNSVTGNHVTGACTGIWLLFSDENTVTENEVSGNECTGILLDASDQNTVKKNKASGNGTFGIELVDHFGSGGSDQNTIAENKASGNEFDGIQVDSSFFGGENLLLENRTDRNGDDGIDVRSSATLSENRADRNGDFGILAGSGVTDGGGNEASRNGNPAQCEGVACQ